MIAFSLMKSLIYGMSPDIQTKPRLILTQLQKLMTRRAAAQATGINCRITRWQFEELHSQHAMGHGQHYRLGLAKRTFITSGIFGASSVAAAVLGWLAFNFAQETTDKTVCGAAGIVVAAALLFFAQDSFRMAYGNLQDYNKADPKIKTQDIDREVMPDDDFLMLSLPPKVRRSRIISAVEDEQARLETCRKKCIYSSVVRL